VPLGIRREEQLLAGLLEVEQRLRQLRVEVHEALRIGDDLGLELAFEVRGVHRRANQVVEARVVEFGAEVAAVEQLDELAVDARLGQREQRVQEHPARLTEVDPDLVVGLALRLVRQDLRAVGRLRHVAEAVGLHDVAERKVDDQAAREQVGVKTQVAHRQPAFEQALLHVRVGPGLPGVHVVVHERVVHVEPDRPDRAHVQRAVAEDAPLGRGLEVGTNCRHGGVLPPGPG
jgi:hypothetical protein